MYTGIKWLDKLLCTIYGHGFVRSTNGCVCIHCGEERGGTCR